MELESFLQTIITNQKQAEKITTVLFDILPVNKKNEKAILDFFHGLPKIILENKDFTQDFMSNYFFRYKVNENNIKYYDQYIKENIYKNNIIANNPEWKFKEIVFEYDTLKDLLSNFNNATYTSHEEGLNFIETNKLSFQKFSKNSKKFEKSLIKNQVFTFLLKDGYDTFKNFCLEFNVDNIQVLKKMYTGEYSNFSKGLGLSYLVNNMHDDSLNKVQVQLLLEDIIEVKEHFFEKDKSFLKINPQGANASRNHVSCLFIECIIEENFQYAKVLNDYFKEEIIQGLVFWPMFAQPEPEDSVPTEINKEIIKGACDRLCRLGLSNGNFYKFTQYREPILDKYENFLNKKQKKLK